MPYPTIFVNVGTMVLRERGREGGVGGREGEREGGRKREEAVIASLDWSLHLKEPILPPQSHNHITPKTCTTQTDRQTHLTFLLPWLLDAFLGLLRSTRGSPKSQPTKPWDELNRFCETKSSNSTSNIQTQLSISSQSQTSVGFVLSYGRFGTIATLYLQCK